jgi:aspartyl-tRNA(Asn)/glutamyl-tRNA(Gln) amidotransferase subunit A
VTPVSQWSIHDAHSALAQKKISIDELVLDRLAAIKHAQPYLNCCTCIIEDHAKERLEKLRHAPSQHVLAGLPVAHKDMFYRQGLPCTFGTSPNGHTLPTETALTLTRLDTAGTVQIATLNMAEFAFGATGHNEHFGPCRNPWNPDHMTGGSSSGSAASVAAGLVFGALGSDTGGSIRIPASACGVVGLKPTQGLVPMQGVMPMSRSMDCVGPLARNAQDVAILMDALMEEPASSSYQRTLGRSLKGVKIGVPANYYYDDIDEEIAGLMQESLTHFEQLGCKLVDVTVPDHDLLTSLSYILLGSESAAYHTDFLDAVHSHYGIQTRARLLNGYLLPANAYVAAKQLRSFYTQRFLESVYPHCDLLHTPVLRQPVPTLDAVNMQANPQMNQMITTLSYCTRLTNYLGLPAISQPSGFCRSGLPVGFQLIGKPFDERLLLSAAHGFEHSSGLTNLVAPIKKWCT